MKIFHLCSIIFVCSVSLGLCAETEIFFTPDDNPIKELVRRIDRATKKLHGAVYMLSDQKVATALVAAYKRNVDVQLVLDEFSFGKLGKGHFLGQEKLAVFVYVPHKPGLFEEHMHNKFMIIDSKEVVTGSANWSVSGGQRNQENVVILDSKKVVNRYESQFKLLKQRCLSYKKYSSAPQGSFKNSQPTQKRSKESEPTLDEVITQKQLKVVSGIVMDFFKSFFKR